ncbi:MAG: DUF3052 domain-containing protein [Actinomycetota bacterium]|nr:DUF3052 domain-containing protein [Actinomycetota bacterium]
MSPHDAGYSGTPLPRKLGIRAGDRVAVIAAPEGFAAVLGGLEDGVRINHRLRGRFDVIVAFATRRAALDRRLIGLRDALEPAGGLWLAWPKRVSGMVTDLSDAEVRAIGLATGLVDNKVCAIDETWSALRFVYRRAERPGAAST